MLQNEPQIIHFYTKCCCCCCVFFYRDGKADRTLRGLQPASLAIMELEDKYLSDLE